MDVGAGLQIHHRVATPADRLYHLVDFFLGGRGGRGIFNIGVDLHQNIPANDRGRGLGVVDVGRDDGAPQRDLITYEFRGEEFGD